MSRAVERLTGGRGWRRGAPVSNGRGLGSARRSTSVKVAPRASTRRSSLTADGRVTGSGATDGGSGMAARGAGLHWSGPGLGAPIFVGQGCAARLDAAVVTGSHLMGMGRRATAVGDGRRAAGGG